MLVNEPSLDKLQALRDRLGKPLIVRSAYRTPEHNRAVGGATHSKHMDGAAFDIAIAATIYARFDDWKRGAAMIGELAAALVGSAWARAALRYGVTVFAILLFLLTMHRSGERAGRLAERLDSREKTNEVQRRMLEAAARRPRSPEDLAKRLRDGRF